MEQKTKISAETGRQDLLITRVFELPLHLLYQAFTEAALVEQWMGTRVLELESRDHGSYRFETSHNGQVVFAAHGSIHKLVPNRQLVRTFEMLQMPMGVQLEILDFEALDDDSSKLSMQIIYQSEQHRAEQLKLPFAYGINMAHNRLEELLHLKK